MVAVSRLLSYDIYTKRPWTMGGLRLNFDVFQIEIIKVLVQRKNEP